MDPFVGSPWRPYVALTVTVGSRAYGLHRPDSDTDTKGFYVPPTSSYFGLVKPPEQLESHDPDMVYYEIEKFIRLALKGNPTILETLWSHQDREWFPNDPNVHLFAPHARDQIVYLLRYGREWFLGKHLVAPFLGMAKSHMHKIMGRHAETDRERRDAMHMLRIMYSARQIAREGSPMLDVGVYRDHLLRVRNGTFDLGETLAEFEMLYTEVRDAFACSTLPDRPQTVQADAWLRQLRRDML
jgi:predicted nucleotidyltransferase